MKSSVFFATALCLSCFAALPLLFHRQPSKKLSQREESAHAASVPNHAAVLNNYGKIPLSFEANQGQADPRVKFLSRSGQMTLLLTLDEALMAFAGSAPEPNRGGKGLSRSRLA